MGRSCGLVRLIQRRADSCGGVGIVYRRVGVCAMWNRVRVTDKKRRLVNRVLAIDWESQHQRTIQLAVQGEGAVGG